MMTKDTLELLATMDKPVVTQFGSTRTPIAAVDKRYEMVDLSRYFPPTHIKARGEFSDPTSFADYVNKFKDDGTVIFAAITDNGVVFEAVLDFHQAKSGQGSTESLPTGHVPRDCAHRARFQGVETKDWMASNGKRMDQVTFATFLEEHQDLIVTPPGADLLELVQHLEGHKSARFNSAQRLRDGRIQLVFEEDIELRGAENSQIKSGSMELPREILAAIKPFEGVDHYKVPTRIKYRIEGRKMEFWYETVNAHKIVRDAVKGMFELIQGRTTLAPFLGSVTNG